MQTMSSSFAARCGVTGSLDALSVHGFARLRALLMVPLSIAILCGFTSGCSGGAGGTSVSHTEFWVSPNGDDDSPGTRSAPFLTLERARDAVRALDEIQRGGDIVITIKGGNHRLTRPLALDWRDSGRDGHPVVYRAAPGEHPVISGSEQVLKWSLCDPELGIYQAYVGRRESRQLYVNGRRAIRARTAPYPAGFRPAYFTLFGMPIPMGIEFIPTGLNPDKWKDPSQCA